MPVKTAEPFLIESVTGDLMEKPVFKGLDCLIELKSEDFLTGIQFRDCLIDYTRCPNSSCIKKLV